jgi:transcriptional regulator with XRE-family HTH domain
MDIRLVFGKNVRRFRTQAQLSQEELGARLDADQAYVSRLEAGQVNVTIDTLAAVAKALSVSPAALLEAASVRMR